MPTGELIRRTNVVAAERLDFIKERGLEFDLIQWLGERDQGSRGV